MSFYLVNPEVEIDYVGEKVTGEYWAYSSHTVDTQWFKINGRWITPYEQRVRGVMLWGIREARLSETVRIYFKANYGHLTRMLMGGNACLGLVKKEDAWRDGYLVVPFNVNRSPDPTESP